MNDHERDEISRKGRGLVARLSRRAAGLTGVGAISLAVLTTPVHAASALGTCFPLSSNTSASGVNISFPRVDLAQGTTMILTVITQAASQPEVAGIYFWDGQSPYWYYKLPEIFGGEWRPGPQKVNAPGEVAASIPGYNLTLNAWFKKEYFDTSNRLTGVEDNVPVRMADGGVCHS
jgi:hypothetical protein